MWRDRELTTYTPIIYLKKKKHLTNINEKNPVKEIRYNKITTYQNSYPQSGRTSSEDNAGTSHK